MLLTKVIDLRLEVNETCGRFQFVFGYEDGRVWLWLLYRFLQRGLIGPVYFIPPPPRGQFKLGKAWD